MKIRKSILILFIFVLYYTTAISGFALDFGGFINNSSSISVSTSVSFLQQDNLALWFQSELGKHFDFYVQGSAQGSYSYPSANMTYLFDMDKLTLKGQFPITDISKPTGNIIPSIFQFTLGRFNFKDFSGYILNHKLDGFGLSFGYPDLNMEVRFGYSGFLLKPTSSIFISKEDILDLDRATVFFATPRVIGQFALTIPSIFKQSISLETLFQEDLRTLRTPILNEDEETYNPQDGGLVDTQYIGLGSTGSIIPSLYYGIFGYLGTGRMLSYLEDSDSSTGYSYKYTPILSYLAGLRIRYFTTSFLDSYSLIEAIYSSGDATDNSFYEGNTDTLSQAFNPISHSNLALVFSPVLKNIVSIKAEFSIKPLSKVRLHYFKNFQTRLNGYVFLRPTTGPISKNVIPSTSNSLFIGSEGDIFINWRPFSDLGVSLGYGIFVPGIFVPGTFESLEHKATLKVSMSF